MSTGTLTVTVEHAGGTITVTRAVTVVEERTMAEPVAHLVSDEGTQMRVAGTSIAAAIEAQP